MRRSALGVAALFLLASSACSLGPKEDWAEAIHDAPVVARRAGTARVRVITTVKVIETVIRQTPKPLVSRSDGVVDFSERRSRLIGASKDKPKAFFDDLVAYLPRSKASIGTRKQRWASFDFRKEPSVDIDGTDRRLAVGASLISPSLATELLEGVLTGSIERRGSEPRAGAQTTRYSARLSQDAAAREVDDEDRREGVVRTFDSLGIQEDVFPVDVWLDGEGRTRRIRLVLRQQKDRVNAFELRIAWEFYGFGTRAEIDLPARDDTVERRRIKDFIIEFVREQV